MLKTLLEKTTWKTSTKKFYNHYVDLVAFGKAEWTITICS